MIPDSEDTGFFSFGHIQKIIDYMEEHLLEELTPAIIAENFPVSASTLSSLFKIVCGMTNHKPNGDGCIRHIHCS